MQKKTKIPILSIKKFASYSEQSKKTRGSNQTCNDKLEIEYCDGSVSRAVTRTVCLSGS